MGLSFWQIALVVLLCLLLFGRGKIPQMMTDLAEGIKSFKKAVAAEDAEPKSDPEGGKPEVLASPAELDEVEKNRTTSAAS